MAGERVKRWQLCVPENHGLAWNSVTPNPEILGRSEGLMAGVGGDRASVTHGQELSISIREASKRHRRDEGSQQCTERKWSDF